MEVEKSSRDGLHAHAIDAHANSISAQQVVKAAHEELLQLMRQRAEVMKRIGTVKQTIAGLANLFGEQVRRRLAGTDRPQAQWPSAWFHQGVP